LASRRFAAFLLAAVLAAGAAFGQGMKMSVAQLKAVLRSSIRLNHPDKQVADYVRKVQLTERLTHRDVEELLGEGLGPRAAEALRQLVAATASLPPPVKEPAPVKPVPMPPPPSTEQARVISEARELALNYTIVIVTHNMQQAARVSDYTAFLMMDSDRAGALVESEQRS